MPLCWSSTLPLNIPSHRAGPLGVAFVGLLLCPRCLQCEHGPSGIVPVVAVCRFTHANEHAVHGPLGSCARSLARCSRHTTPARLPWELCSWSCYSVHVVYKCQHGPSGVVSSSCVVSPHANLKSTSPTTPAQVPLGGVTFVDFRLAWGETTHDDDGHNSRGTHAGIVHDDVDAVAESRT